MKKALIFCALFIAIAASAQKKPLDQNAYDKWENTGSVAISDDGSILTYRIFPQAGDARLIFRNLKSGREIVVDRGSDAVMTSDSRWAVFKVKPSYMQARDAKLKKVKGDKAAKDTICFLDLRTFELNREAAVKGIRTDFDGNGTVVYQSAGKGGETIVMKLGSDSRDTLRNVEKLALNRQGTALAVTFKKTKESARSAAVFQLDGMKKTVLSEGKAYYSLPVFNNAGDKLVFLASSDTSATGSKRCAVYLYEGGSTEELIPQGCTDGLPSGFAITEKASPKFSKNSGRIFLGASRPIPPKDPDQVDFETAGLDIWNWDAPMLPPEQKVRRGALEGATADIVINLSADRHKVIALGKDEFEVTAIPDGGEGSTGIIRNYMAYKVQYGWDLNNFNDVYKVDIDSGERSLLFERVNGRPALSPSGKYMTWFDGDDYNYYCYNIATGEKVCLNGQIDGIFYDDEDDRPTVHPSFGDLRWCEGEEAVILTEKFDIWKVTPDGKTAICLTKGAGRESDCQYRIFEPARETVSPELKSVGVSGIIGRKDMIYMTTYNRGTKENGLACVSATKPGLKSGFTAPYSYLSVTKALDADVFAYRKGNFRDPYDIHSNNSKFNSEKKLSDIDPQQDEYLWGDARLVHWNAYDGTPLDGILYTPGNLDPDGKYPMIVYYYEKRSQTLYYHNQPEPSRSVIIIPVFVSQGYVVFVPDITYETGHPGESAYNCVISGVESMCSQFPFIDKDRMGLQGTSWGGYQTAYLITRTDMFAAAGAGAPVGDMISSYGGIRWGSGRSRAYQYEHTQSRIGKSLWEEGALELYLENSPIFHIQNVHTPLLIMHNDADEAVPWYQGIELFMSLRRFNKPSWMLQYNGEAHNLGERRNRLDYSRRIEQFFDHYLKGEPMPAWMKTGVPLTRKGQYFGFETEPEATL